ncbi:MAG TPA: NUDIX domain-containing protein [Candidatus Aphodousia gallistercoris]|nr:NUDIX domain-containing protein [Candidatus Aphodousia gallistercoris]
MTQSSSLSMYEVLSMGQMFENLKAKLTQPLPAGIFKFCAASETIGYVSKDVAMKMATISSEFRLEDDRLIISDEALATEQTRTVAMRKAAALLHQLGIVKNPASELVDVKAGPLDPVFCQAPRELTRVLGLMTTSVRVTGYDQEGRIVLGKRLQSKAIGGGLWDSLTAGLVKASEEPKQALFRELFEEAGLVADDVELTEGARFVQELVVPEGFLREQVLTFDAQIKPGLTPKNYDGQVTEFKSFTPEELVRAAEADEMMYAAGIASIESLCRRADRRIDDHWLRYRGQIWI